MTDSDFDSDEPYLSIVTVTADKRSRTVEVDAPIDEDGRRNVTLSIHPAVLCDTWTWLTPEEAREVADALVAAAEGVESLAASEDREPDDIAVAHSTRWRKVSTLYPRMVAEAYGRDIERALADTDEQVAATVADWERAQGMEPRDWKAIGREERDDDDET